MKITITHHAKRGLPEYSSISYGACLEIELRDGTPEEVAATFKAAARDLRALVEAELAREQPAANGNGNGRANNGNGNGASQNGPAANGNGARGPRNAGSAGDQMVSPKQVKFLRGLSSRLGLRPRDLDQRAQEMVGDPHITVRDLTKRQASDLIESMLAEAEAAA